MENSTITFITDQLKALTSIPSPSGFTKEVAQYLVSTLEEMGFTRHWADISGARLTVKTAPYIQEMEKYTQVSY